jgi:N-acetylmuramoyl-L-alanine amidase
MKMSGNAGHSEIDPGAVDLIQPEEGDVIDTKEADWCAEVMFSACEKFAAKGHDAQFIQDDSLENICAISNEWGADVFLSLHLNAAGSVEAQGPETFYLIGSEEGRKLANIVQQTLVDKLGAHDRDRGIKPANFYVLKHTDAVSVLIEAGFITNTWEESIIHQQWFKDAVSDAIVEGVLQYEGGKNHD